jgi:hypothetical protein
MLRFLCDGGFSLAAVIPASREFGKQKGKGEKTPGDAAAPPATFTIPLQFSGSRSGFSWLRLANLSHFSHFNSAIAMHAKPFFLAALASFFCSNSLNANPRITSWFTENSGQYARIYETTAAETARTSSTTWTRGQGTQSSPTYADVSEVSYSANWVYIRTTGLASHVMGPWYLNAAKSQDFPNFPANMASTYRIPLTPTIPTTKTLTGLGASGVMVNGVSIFDSRDAFSYVSASSTDATPVNGLTGDGVWNRDGYHNEGVTFDPGLAHQAGKNCLAVSVGGSCGLQCDHKSLHRTIHHPNEALADSWLAGRWAAALRSVWLQRSSGAF